MRLHVILKGSFIGACQTISLWIFYEVYIRMQENNIYLVFPLLEMSVASQVVPINFDRNGNALKVKPQNGKSQAVLEILIMRILGKYIH